MGGETEVAGLASMGLVSGPLSHLPTSTVLRCTAQCRAAPSSARRTAQRSAADNSAAHLLGDGRLGLHLGALLLNRLLHALALWGAGGAGPHQNSASLHCHPQLLPPHTARHGDALLHAAAWQPEVRSSCAHVGGLQLQQLLHLALEHVARRQRVPVLALLAVGALRGKSSSSTVCDAWPCSGLYTVGTASDVAAAACAVRQQTWPSLPTSLNNPAASHYGPGK